MSSALIFQSDFGLQDGAVSAMYGVAYTVDPTLQIFNLTHDIPQYNIWEASYRLIQTISYWPKDSVFVSVVDPGVGTNRRSIVVKTICGKYIITPDNGTLTHIKRMLGITEARELDEKVNRLPCSGASYTFYGRDVYSYTGARLAAGKVSFEQLGEIVSVDSIVELPFMEAYNLNGVLKGWIDVLDVRFGSLWTNISLSLFKELGLKYGDIVQTCIYDDKHEVYKNTMIYARSFAQVPIGEPLLYVNSLDKLAVAINQGSFSKTYNISAGYNWRISIASS